MAAWGWKFGARGHLGLAAVAAVLASVAFISGAGAQDEDSSDIAGTLQDAIVGTWSGQAAQPDTDPFDVTADVRVAERRRQPLSGLSSVRRHAGR